MRLRELLNEVEDVVCAGGGDPELLGISADSRAVAPGFLFAAIPGNAADGARFVDDAVARGAVAILAGENAGITPPVPVVSARDPRKALAEAASAFYRHPSRGLDLVGVTGTNGKTSTAYMLRHILNAAGRKCGMLGTIEYDVGGRVEPSPLTTPDAVSFARNLADMRGNGCKAAAAEVSSHALSQRRVWSHRFAAAVFTNLTRDHLDYHGDMDAYLAAKRMLFLDLDDGAAAVVNLDDPSSGRIVAGSRAAVCGYSLKDSVRAGDRIAKIVVLRSDLSGQVFSVEGAGLSGEIAIPLIGLHNVANFAGAMLAALHLGVGLPIITDACRTFPGVPGRLERLDAPGGAAVFVDYAHTDGALESMLSILRPLTPGRIITVFGCGGDRDRGKRPLMARAAESGSDLVAVTSDNPRTENPRRIFADIMPGFVNPSRVTVIPDRAEAVAWAVGGARRGDAVLVAGKGHENYQILGTEKIHLDDRELVRNAFGARRAACGRDGGTDR